MTRGLTDVVKHLLILNILLFIIVSLPIAQHFPDLALYYPGDTRFRPYQLVTHMFMHASQSHIFFNMFGLFMFGPHVERYMGSKNFFILYFLSGFGALLAHFAVQYSLVSGMDVTQLRGMVGASGALMGVVIAFATIYPNMKLMLIFPPIPIKAKYMALFYVGIDLFSGITGAQANVANFAHLGGALTGFILTYYFFKGNSYRR